MSVEPLFLAHSSTDSDEVHLLAEELRLRGIAPWVDKQGGFSVGDHSEDEARRAIRERCWGLLLYATVDVFESDFVRRVEIDEASRRKRKDPGFSLIAVPRGISFSDLRKLTLEKFRQNLADYHSVGINGDDVHGSIRRVAQEVLQRRVIASFDSAGTGLSLQISSRDLMPDDVRDLLRVDATRLLRDHPCRSVEWGRLQVGLTDAKDAIAQTYGRPVVRVHGSKHLTAAFITGQVFSQFDLEVRQTRNEVWTCQPVTKKATARFEAGLSEEADGDGSVTLEVRSGRKNVEAAVSQHLVTEGLRPSVRVLVAPAGEPGFLNNTSCLELAGYTALALEDGCSRMNRAPQAIHIFSAAPQALMMMLGKSLTGMPPVVLHEWTGDHYCVSYDERT